MRFKRLAWIALFVAAAAYASAVSVAFQIVQHGDSDIRSSSYLMEEKIFDFFFGKGIIISNSPAVVSDSLEADPALFEDSLYEAEEGGVDFFIELTVSYNISGSRNPDAALLENIEYVSWRAVEVDSGNVIGSGKRIPGAASNFKNRQKGVSDFTVLIAEDIYKVIRR